MRRGSWLLVLAGCGRLGFDPNGAQVDGATLRTSHYLKASNPHPAYMFGSPLAVSSDGSTLVIASIEESSAATGVGGNQSDTSAVSSGAVYVFIRVGSSWAQQAYVKASNAQAGDLFGMSVGLSADGNTLAVGAAKESSSAAGVGGNQADNSMSQAGAVYVFTRSGATWTQQAYIKASNPRVGAQFGGALGLSGSGNTLVVAAVEDNSAATGLDGNQLDTTQPGAGAAYVFERNGTNWQQSHYVKASNTRMDAFFGTAIAIAGDGNTFAVAAPFESGGSTGINGNQAFNATFQQSGAVYVFTRSGATWAQQAYAKASNNRASLEFGTALAFTSDGNMLAVGSIHENSGAQGVDGNQSDTSRAVSGAAYLFERTGVVWSQSHYFKASNTDADDEFSTCLALAPDGSVLVAGAPAEASASTGLGGDQLDNSLPFAGAGYVFYRGSTWSQVAYVKATSPGAVHLGGGCGVGPNTITFGAGNDGSLSAGVDGNPADTSGPGAGAAWVFE